MKHIACFCIPAHGHTNPMLPVVTELVRRGHRVRFYSFADFEAKIRATGAEFVPCDSFLPALTAREENSLMHVSITQMTLQSIRTTLRMDTFLSEEFRSFQPDVVFSDSACFWGKLSAWKHGVPLVVSTSTFAFNQLSSGYMKQSPKELADMIGGLPRISKELKTLRPCGYRVKRALQLVQSDNRTDSIVYTSRRFQPFAESFTDHYLFAGPSVFSDAVPNKQHARPLVYISMGTVINDRPDLYRDCIDALKNEPVDVLISCGRTLDPRVLGPLPEHVQVFPFVDQLDVLARADVFLTHCGMNSVSESLFMATPMVLYPQTGEQQAVAKRTAELGAGVLLKDDSAAGIRAAVLQVLQNDAYKTAAKQCSDDFRSCAGPAGAADFILTAPHTSDGVDLLAELNKGNGKLQLLYWLFASAVLVLFGLLVGWKYVWILGVAAGVLSAPVTGALQKKRYAKLVRKMQKDKTEV